MSGNIVARRYARALFALGRQDGLTELGELGRDLQDVKTAVESSGDLRRLFKSPLFSTEDKLKVLNELLAALKVSGYCSNFMRLLAEKGRLDQISAIVDVFNELLDVEKGVIRGEIVTAVELDEDGRKSVQRTLERQSDDKTFILDYSVNPDLIAGVLLKIGDQVLDASLRAQLSILKDNIKRGDEGHAD